MNASPITLHAAPSSGFDDPFEMLSACHERVGRMLGLLERLAAHLHGHGADAQARQAARDVVRYFDVAAPAHHEDEERHVLPLLAASANGGLRALAARLHEEHLAMAASWPGVRKDLLAVAEGTWMNSEAAAGSPMPPGWRAFVALYREHVAAEDATAYPAAAARLDSADTAAMGAEMASRRGLRPQTLDGSQSERALNR